MNDIVYDGNSLFARAWYAAKQEPGMALHIATTMVLQTIDQEDQRIGVPISRTLFAWDGRAKTDKKRDPKPKAYVDTRYRFQEALLSLFGTQHGYHAEYEADDIVATAAFSSKAKQVFVCSGDKDLMQLQGGNILYYDLNSKQILTARKICLKFSVKRPSQIPLALAITGDAGDNISGIPRWGPKKVAKLFEGVTEQMVFSEALAAVQQQIPENLMPFFLESLDKTLLFTDVEGVPEPTPLVFCGLAEVRAFKIDGIAQNYERVAMQYEDRKAILTSMIRGSKSGSDHPIGD
jgi:5'-3' exonuclease